MITYLGGATDRFSLGTKYLRLQQLLNIFLGSDQIQSGDVELIKYTT